MAKTLHNNVFDAALDKVATCTKMTFCSALPANKAGIAALKLAEVTLDSGDYTIADGTVSGRKVTIAAQTGIVPDANGTVTYVVFDDGVTLLAATTVTSQVVATTQIWDSPAIVLELTDPV